MAKESENGAPNPVLDPTYIFDAIEFPDAYKISYLASAIVVPAYEDVLQETGLLRAEYNLLMSLSYYPAMSSRDVAILTRMPRNSISRAVHRMEAEGYITRASDPGDGRKTKLTVTKSGREMHQKVATYLVAREKEVIAALNTEEHQQLQHLLRKLATHAAALDR